MARVRIVGAHAQASLRPSYFNWPRLVYRNRRLRIVRVDEGIDFVVCSDDLISAVANLSDLTLYVIDVAAGDKIPPKGGPGITRSDLLVINKIDLAPYVGADLLVMERDAKRMRVPVILLIEKWTGFAQGTLYNLDENHSRSAGRVTSPVNFTRGHPDFSLPLTSEILTALKNRCVIIGGNLAFCLLLQLAMNDKKTWWQVLPLGKKGSICVGVIAFALVVFLAWKAFSTPTDRGLLALQQQEEKIRDMEDRLARLQKELEESSKQIASLQAGSDETTRARRTAQRNVNNSRREETRLADQNPSTELRFKQGRPPGFIRRDDAVLMK